MSRFPDQALISAIAYRKFTTLFLQNYRQRSSAIPMKIQQRTQLHDQLTCIAHKQLCRKKPT